MKTLLFALVVAAFSFLTCTLLPAAENVAASRLVTFTVTVEAGTRPFVYKWEKAPLAGGEFVALPHEGESFVIESATDTDSGRYRVRVSNPAGETVSPELEIRVWELPRGVAIGVRVAERGATP